MNQQSRMWAADCPGGNSRPASDFPQAHWSWFWSFCFRLDPSGTPYFLEVNPSGQWLDLELEANHPISEAWARVLVFGLGSEHETQFEPWNTDDIDKLMNPLLDIEFPTQWKQVL